MAEYAAPLIAERGRTWTNDLISLLVEARIEDTDADSMDDSRSLTDDEANTFTAADHRRGGTTHKAYGNLMFMPSRTRTARGGAED